MSQNKEEGKAEEKETEPVLKCPHCDQFIIIEKINCGIFRHGIFKGTGQQIDPHASKASCDSFVQNRLIYGCGKPFQIGRKKNSTNDNQRHNQETFTFYTEKCDYI